MIKQSKITIKNGACKYLPALRDLGIGDWFRFANGYEQTHALYVKVNELREIDSIKCMNIHTGEVYQKRGTRKVIPLNVTISADDAI